MIQSARQRRKKRQDLMGIVGIIALFVIFGGGFYFLQSTNDPLDEFKCSIKNGPNAVTAIIFDKSQIYTNDQVTDIKTSFNLWLAGNEATTKNSHINQFYNFPVLETIKIFRFFLLQEDEIAVLYLFGPASMPLESMSKVVCPAKLKCEIGPSKNSTFAPICLMSFIFGFI